MICLISDPELTESVGLHHSRVPGQGRGRKVKMENPTWGSNPQPSDFRGRSLTRYHCASRVTRWCLKDNTMKNHWCLKDERGGCAVVFFFFWVAEGREVGW